MSQTKAQVKPVTPLTAIALDQLQQLAQAQTQQIEDAARMAEDIGPEWRLDPNRRVWMKTSSEPAKEAKP